MTSEILMAGLCAFRFYNYRVTGFFVSDEYGYYYNAANGGIYGDRWFFGWLNLLLFRVFGIGSPDSFSYFLPFYLFVWSGLTILTFYSLLRLLGFDGATVALSLLGSFVLISFILLSLGFLTEGVGLCFAMLGIYGLLAFLKSDTDRGFLLWPFFASLFLGFAGGTREPYVALEIGGALLVLAGALKHRALISSRYGRGPLVLLSVVLFLVPTGFLLYANTATTSEVTPLAIGLVNTVFTNPANTVAPIVTSATVTNIITRSVTQIIVQNSIVTKTAAQNLTQIIVHNSITTTLTTYSVYTTNYSITTTLTTYSVYTTNSEVVTSHVYAPPFYGQSLLLNTVAIFAGGLVLGWGPIAFTVALIGFAILFREALRGQLFLIALLGLTLFALGSDLVVSFLFAPDPYYLTFRNYSTIIRFSATALPAFFITAPFFLSRISKNSKRIAGLIAVAGVCLLALVPVYQTYAISNLGYTTVSPFSLDYRSPAAQVRDYLLAHESDAPFRILGVPYGWYFTPGLENLKFVSVYSSTPEQTLSPVLNYSSFLSQRWTEFYVYSSSSYAYERATGSYFLQFIPGANQQSSNQTNPFRVINATIVIKNPDFLLTQVELSWP